MTNLQSRISGVVLNRLADYGIDMIAREIADIVAEAVLSLPGIVTMDTDRLLDALYAAWDGGNATGLDGWVGPGRGMEPIDDDALLNRDRDVDRALAKLLAAAVQAQEEQ